MDIPEKLAEKFSDEVVELTRQVLERQEQLESAHPPMTLELARVLLRNVCTVIARLEVWRGCASQYGDKDAALRCDGLIEVFMTRRDGPCTDPDCPACVALAKESPAAPPWRH